MKLSNGVEKYEIEVTKMGQNYSFFLTMHSTVLSWLGYMYLIANASISTTVAIY